MSLIKPKVEDIRKIHAEVNQLINQRFTLMPVAVSLSGVMIAWSIPKDLNSPGPLVNTFAYAMSTSLTALLFVLFLVGHLLKARIPILTTYLIVTNSSPWEIDFARFRRWDYFGYTKTQSLVFLALGVFSNLFPIILSIIFSQRIRISVGLYFCIGTGIVYLILVWGMGFLNWWDIERRSKENWEALNS